MELHDELIKLSSPSADVNKKRIYKIVLTGGPCGGKTTCQSRLSTFFEDMGWKVFRIAETAYTFLSGGLKFDSLDSEAIYRFQGNLLECMIKIDETFMDLARADPSKKILIICDRGCMDATAYLEEGQWERLAKERHWNEVELRDRRYDQVIHLVSAAKGAKEFYTCEGHGTRMEGIDLASHLDDMVAQAWVGHPYYDVIDNSTCFEGKIKRTLMAVCERIGINVQDRLAPQSKKRKFLIAEMPPDDVFPGFRDFDVVHHYLVTPNAPNQARIRKRGTNGSSTYTYTIRRSDVKDVELKRQINYRDYELLLTQVDTSHHPIYKKRRAFLWNDHYYQLDTYIEPCDKSRGLIFLETYTVKEVSLKDLPPFLKVIKEVTGDPCYSMFNLSKKDVTNLQTNGRQRLTNRTGLPHKKSQRSSEARSS